MMGWVDDRGAADRRAVGGQAALEPDPDQVRGIVTRVEQDVVVGAEPGPFAPASSSATGGSASIRARSTSIRSTGGP